MIHNQKGLWVWGIVYVFLLLTLFTPLVLITLSFIMIPVLVMYVRQSAVKFAASYALCLLAVYLITLWVGLGAFGLSAIVLALFFLAPVLVMGNFYKRRSPARTVITAGIVAFLIQQLLLLVALSLAGFNAVSEMENMMRESIRAFPALVEQLPAELVEQMVQTVSLMLPVLLIGVSFYFTVITHWIGRRLLNNALVKAGEEPLPAFKPVREWMLPRSFIWYYLIAIVLDYVIDYEQSSIMQMIIINLVPLLMTAFAVQAIAFLAFVAHHKGWNNALPITALVLMIIFSPLMQLFALIGLFDVAFPIRERMRNSSL